MKATVASNGTESTVTYNGETVTIDRYAPIVDIIDTLYIDLGMTEAAADRLAARIAL